MRLLLGALLALSACSLVNAYDEVVEGSGTGGGSTTSGTTSTGGAGGSGGSTTMTTVGVGGAGGGGGSGPGGLACDWALGSPLEIKELEFTLSVGAAAGPIGNVAYLYSVAQGAIQASKIGLQTMTLQSTNAVADPGGALRLLDARPLGPVSGPMGVLVTQDTGTFANAVRVFNTTSQVSTFPLQSGQVLGFTEPPQSGRFNFVGPEMDRFNYALSGRQSNIFRAMHAQRLPTGAVGKQGVIAESSGTSPARVRGLVQTAGVSHAFLGAVAPEPSRLLSVADTATPSSQDALIFGPGQSAVLDTSRDADAKTTSIAAAQIVNQKVELRVGEFSDVDLPQAKLDAMTTALTIDGNDIPRGQSVWINRTTFAALFVVGTSKLDLRLVAPDGRVLFEAPALFADPQQRTIGDFVAVGRTESFDEQGGELALCWTIRTGVIDRLFGGKLTCVPETGGM
jgi:hypothetical protein